MENSAHDIILKSLIDRIQRLEEQKKEIGQNIAEVYKEAKGHGYDTKAIREVIKQAKMEVAYRDELEFLVKSYKKIMGI